MTFNFELILFALTAITGFFVLVDILFFRKRRKAKNKSPSKFFEFHWSFFPIFLIVFLLRSFIAEPFRIPSSSMRPTLLAGDFILVNKYTYGVRLPVINKKIISINNPKRGDVIVFKYPVNPKINFIKRIVALPGDTIMYKNKTLYVNNQAVKLEPVGEDLVVDEIGQSWHVKRLKEYLNDKEHEIYIRPVKTYEQDEIVVPENSYFVMGDNRDNSEDGRVWGFVPDKLLVGKAFGIWLSWDSVASDLRWQRIGSSIH